MFRPGNGLCTEHVDHNGISKLKEHLLHCSYGSFISYFLFFSDEVQLFHQVTLLSFSLTLDSFDRCYC